MFDSFKKGFKEIQLYTPKISIDFIIIKWNFNNIETSSMVLTFV
jgi:hypothetical protein